MVNAIGRRARVPAVLALLVMCVAVSCSTPSGQPTPAPVVTIENESGAALDIVTFSHRTGASVKQTTLANGGMYGAEPAGGECDDGTSYFVEAGGRRIATLDRPGCVGAHLVVTPEMLLAPEASQADPSWTP